MTCGIQPDRERVRQQQQGVFTGNGKEQTMCLMRKGFRFRLCLFSFLLWRLLNF